MTWRQLSDQNGLTLIELLMAMALFSGMLLIVSIGFITAIRLYRGGLSSRESQTATGYGMEEMLRDVRAAYSADPPTALAGSTPQLPSYSMCLHLAGRDVMYQISGSVLSRFPNCTGVGTAEIVSGSTVKVLSFKPVVNTPAAPSAQSVTITLMGAASGGNTDATSGACTSDIKSGFCANSTITSTASLRGKQGAL